MNTITYRIDSMQEVLLVLNEIKKIGIKLSEPSEKYTKVDLFSALDIIELIDLFDDNHKMIINFRPDSFILYSERYNIEDKCKYVSFDYFMETLTLYNKFKLNKSTYYYTELSSIIKVETEELKVKLTNRLGDLGLIEYPPEVKKDTSSDKTYMAINTNSKTPDGYKSFNFYFNDEEFYYTGNYYKQSSSKKLLDTLDILDYLDISIEKEYIV